MTFNFLNRATEQSRYWNAWLDGFIAAEIVALVLLVGYCLAHTF
jgi:hypothetical protein